MRHLMSLLNEVESRARSDSEFRRKLEATLALLLADGSRIGRKRGTMTDLTGLSPSKYAQAHGTEELRRHLERYTVTALRKFVREECLSQLGVSRLSKDDAINKILVAARKAA